MKNITIFVVIIFCASCGGNTHNNKMPELSEALSSDALEMSEEIIVPGDKLIHKGIFNQDLDEYYYTLSDKQYNQFDVYVVKREKHGWSKPEKAFFNSDFNEHGMSFSPNGKSLFFSSTRPTGMEGVPPTWHIWKSTRDKEKWTAPEFINIPNLSDKLVSHPIITNNGNLFFHSSNLDYTQMDIYQSKETNGEFEPAVKTSIRGHPSDLQKCTPYVSPDEKYLLFASIEDQLDLMISFNDGNGHWINTRKLSDKINAKGQGNPWVTPDNKILFYTTGNSDGTGWKVNSVNIENELKNN